MPQIIRKIARTPIWILVFVGIALTPFFFQDDSNAIKPLLELPQDEILFQQGDMSEWSEPDFDDSDWAQVTLPDNWWQRGIRPMGAKCWYRIPFTLDNAFRNQTLVVSLGYVGSVSEIYLNGERIGGEGSFYPVSIPPQRTVHAAILPNQLLHYGGAENLLSVRVKSLVGAGGLLSDSLTVYPSDAFWDIKERAEYSRETWKIIVFAICLVCFCLFMGISYLIKDQYRGAYRATAWIAFANGFGVLYHSHLFQTSTGVSELVVLAYFVMTIILPVAMYQLARSVGRKKASPWFNGIMALSVVGYVGTALAAGPNFHLSALAYAILSSVSLILSLVLIVGGIRGGIPNAKVVLLGLLIFTTAGSLELISLAWGWLPYATLFWGPVELGIIGFLLAMSWVLLSQYFQIHRREQMLGQRLLKIQDDERQRIGHNLHDGIAQDLIALQYEIRLLQKGSEGKKAEQLRQVSEYTREILSETRALAEDFQPFSEGNRSLVGSIEEWEGQLQRRHKVKFTNEFSPVDVDGTIAEAIYRVIQEATQNACRHGRAEEIKVRLSDSNDDSVKLQIEDYGVGFDPLQINSTSLGVRFMKDRVEACGGQFSLKSELGKGTVVSVWLPKADERNLSKKVMQDGE
ncbi:ATP-binding protein [Rubellicoccus peritrichatus]|uniref:Oxygen sensor histidine kinase NreB n=1 Tax=Rubellicoccus peritrichatus TaxID=3080537 RepID=A0AAQ3QU83_9BACT|nr:ATP-binding protein [Puniceicoccus sp. CR14]WOO39377.1 histidine kinase [Puniceicoccus sp. CR14]